MNNEFKNKDILFMNLGSVKDLKGRDVVNRTFLSFNGNTLETTF